MISMLISAIAIITAPTNYPSFTLTVSYAVTANISHFYKCLSFLYGVAVPPIGQKSFCVNSLDIIVQSSVIDCTLKTSARTH